MRALATVLVLTAGMAACAPPPRPVDVVLGEACERCKRPIIDERIAAERIGDNGFALKFRTIHCLSTWIAKRQAADEGFVYVANYGKKEGWVRADRASFVRVIVNPNTMERDFIAFSDPALAAEAARKHNSAVVGWDDVLEMGRAEPLGGN